MAASSSRQKSPSSTVTTDLSKRLATVAGAAREAAVKIDEMQWQAISMALGFNPVKPQDAWTQLLVDEKVFVGEPYIDRNGYKLAADLGYVDYTMLKSDPILRISKDLIPDQIVRNALLAWENSEKKLHYKPVGVVVDEKPKSYNIKVYFLLSVSKRDVL